MIKEMFQKHFIIFGIFKYFLPPYFLKSGPSVLKMFPTIPPNIANIV